MRATRPTEVWHIDPTVIRLLDGTRAYLHAVNNHFSRRILAWRVVDTFAPVNSMAVLLDARRRTAGADPVPTVLSDARVEKRQRPDRRAPHDRRSAPEPRLHRAEGLEFDA